MSIVAALGAYAGQPPCLFTLKPDHCRSLLNGRDALFDSRQIDAQVALGTGIQAVRLKPILGRIKIDIPALIQCAGTCPFADWGQEGQGFCVCRRLIRRIGQHAHAVEAGRWQLPGRCSCLRARNRGKGGSSIASGFIPPPNSIRGDSLPRPPNGQSGSRGRWVCGCATGRKFQCRQAPGE